MENVADLHDDILLARIDQALGNERQLLVRILAYLGEIEARRLDLRAGYSSMFVFCTERLRLSESEAFRRLLAARLARQFPVIFELLESGALRLTAIEQLRHYLTPDNHAELLEAACFRNKSQVQELIACRFPKPDEPSTIRRLPERPAADALETTEPSRDAPPLKLESPTLSKPSSRPESGMDPLSAGRYRVRFTAGQALKDKLERALDLMSHANPSFDLAVVVERAVDLLLDKLERTKLGKADHPREPRGAKHGTITRAARREVTERDGERCAWVDETGRRCPSTRFLELDHVQAKARGGSGDAANIRKLCRRHNRLHAEQTFGRDYIESAIHFRQKKRRGPDTLPLTETQTKVLTALTTMGFRATEARAALERVCTDGGAPEASLESLLRGALGVLADARAPSG